MDEPGSESGKRSDRRGAARGTRAGSWAPQEGGASSHLAAPLAPRSPGSFAAAAMGYPDNLLAASDGLPTALLHAIRARLGDRARPGEPLARYTSFRIGGPADLLVLPDTADELAHVLASAAACGTRVTLLGGGSNVLVGAGGRLRQRRHESDQVRNRVDEARTRRTAAQPHGGANAGSIFKNPNGEHAGRLIEIAGLKGTRAGRARISERQASFIVNEGGARAADVKALMAGAPRVGGGRR